MSKPRRRGGRAAARGDTSPQTSAQVLEPNEAAPGVNPGGEAESGVPGKGASPAERRAWGSLVSYPKAAGPGCGADDAPQPDPGNLESAPRVTDSAAPPAARSAAGGA